jgi:hypothetical protein
MAELEVGEKRHGNPQFHKYAALACVAAVMLSACNEQSSVQTYDMPAKQLYAKLKDPALLKSVKADKGYSEVGTRKIVDNRMNEYVTWAYVHKGMQHYWYTATVEPVSETSSKLSLEFFPNAHFSNLPEMSRNMMYAASAEAVRAHLEGRPVDGQKIMARSAVFIVSNPVKSYSEIKKLREQAIAQAKKDGVM